MIRSEYCLWCPEYYINIVCKKCVEKPTEAEIVRSKRKKRLLDELTEHLHIIASEQEEYLNKL